MSRPLVLLSLNDDPVAHALHAALLQHSPPLRVVAVAPREVVETAASDSVALLILSHRIDPTAGVTVLRELGAFGAAPQSIVVFDDAADARRGLVARAGGWEHVVPPDGDLTALLALIDRAILKDALEARLDATSQQFRLLVDNTNDGVYVLREGSFFYTNRRFQEMVGFTHSELLDEGFAVLDRMVASESRPFLEERRRRLAAGLPVEPRYEFVARRKNGVAFDAAVSITYVNVDGKPGAIGIMQDITERKRFEHQLVRKNRELAVLNELSSSINEAVELDETLVVGCRRARALLSARAAGITLLSSDGQRLELSLHDGLDDDVARSLMVLPLVGPSLLASAVRAGEVFVLDDVATDPRVAVDVVKEAGFSGCIVVPLKARSHIHGALFVFFEQGRAPNAEDRELALAIGTLLGSAVEKATLLEAERTSVKRLQALDAIGVAIASTLDAHEVALTLARRVHALFGASRVLIARYDVAQALFLPLHLLDDGEPLIASVPVRRDDSIMGLALVERRPVQRIRPMAGEDSIDPFTEKPVTLLAYEADLFSKGVGAAVAVPVIQDGVPRGALWIGYPEPQPLSEPDLAVLSSLGTHTAIAFKNAELFDARERALDDLRAAQDKLVQSEKLNAIGLIAHGVAHDFNNVLGSILGRAQLLKSQLRDPAQLKHAEIIEKAAVDGAETVRRIQEIGRQDKIDDFVAVDLDDIAKDVMELTQPRWLEQPRAEGRPIEMVLRPSPQKPPLVAANPHQLREVLVNLVHNAVDAMPEGGVISLHTFVDPPGHPGTCEFHVVDSGIGMPEHLTSKIFDPYFTTKGVRGTGLGLSVSQSIIRRHSGDIRVESRTSGPERGTRFVITLPRLADPVAAPDAVDAAPRAEKSNGRARVLVVDDEENIREILSEILQSGGHEVVTAADGAEGLRKLTLVDDFDLVFTDLGLPGMNGYEVAAAIKRLRPRLPVGLVTGWGATLDAEKARAHGVDLVISKPFRFEQVLSLVSEALLAQKGQP